MDRNQAKEFYPILQAFAEGRVIECRTKPSAVKGTSVPNNWTEMTEIEFWNNTEYRIKPESKYRPFKDTKECWQEMQKHQPFGWMIPIGINQKINLTVIGNGCDLEALFKKFTFADGTPFGVKEEEQLWKY